MIAYKLSDVKFNLTKPEDGGHFCGHESHAGQTGFSDKDFEFMIPKTPVNVEEGFEYSRKKRDSEKKKRCPLALIADYKFFELHGMNEGTTINYMINLVQQVDGLYQRQTLDPDNSADYKDYGFTVKYVEVIMDDEETDTTSYKYVDNGRASVSILLKNFAFEEWRPDYCLAHLFTNYDFSGGVLGLAYVGTPSGNRVGGVCTQTYRDPRSGRTKYLNVGLSTANNYGRTVLSSELLFVTGHEFGHNWGSSHDSDSSPECAPSGNRYMMFPAAVDGSQANNYYFSPCSVRAINDVLRAKGDDCFTKAVGSVCGNGAVEEGEECDQGNKASDCCKNCKFTSGSECEPINDGCCGEEGTAKHCKYQLNKVCLETGWSTDKNIHCYKDFTCKVNSTSTNWECMPGSEVSKGDICFDNGRCRDGDCQNLCEYYGKIPCLCAEDDVCQHCCKDNEEAECKPFTNPDTQVVDNLADGKICGLGNCNAGICIIGAQDLQEKFWEVMDRLDANMLARWFKNNIVFVIIVFTSIFWIPISLFVDWLDDKHDLGFLDKVLGSSGAEKKEPRGTMLLQERKSLSTTKSGSPQYLYPKLDDTGV
ncbi:ADAM 17-like protease isoform X1 [Bolinopsis microptera]|uniref:ADAM 17-like protease isoform X1 n=1 Tax=Bolinopsis microptera TaxID=2820187 RepID=UPI003079FF62